MLPLVQRMAKAFSAWLAPAYGAGLELRPDLDQVEGLSAEREALWARVERASFLTVDEKRAAVGYGLASRDEVAPQPEPEDAPSFGGEERSFVKYSPDQPRVPSGNEDGGQWTDGGGGGGSSSGSASRSSSRVRVAQADTGTRNNAGEDERFIELAQARGGRGRVGPRAGENFETTPAQQARLNVAEAYAIERLRQVQRFDPEWRPEPSFVQSAEGAIRRAEGEARSAEARMQELFRDAVPSSRPDWGFNRLTRELREQGYTLKGATDSPGQLLINPRTREEVRIMQRPQTRNRNDAPQKHLYERYYRYRKSDDQTFGAAIPIADKPGVND